MADDPGSDRNPQLVSWNKYGSRRYRLNQSLFGVAVTALAFCIVLGFLTLQSLYHGTGVKRATPVDMPAVARAQECVRVGPVSQYGFGFWWQCRADVRLGNGDVARVTVGNSTLTPNDIGHDVEFRVACYGPNNTNCSYGRPSNRDVSIALGLLTIIEWLIVLTLAAGALGYFLRAVLGVPRFMKLLPDRGKSRP